MLLNGKYFAMHNTINSRKYLEALFSRTLLKVISKYGFKLLTTKEIYLEIKELLISDTSNLLKLTIGVEEESKQKYYILLKRRPSKTILDTLTSKNYYFKYDKTAKRLYFTKYNGDKLDLLYKEDSIYKIALLNNAYYSGVIPRLRKIIELTDLVNTKVNSIILEVERTTFALEDSIDNTEINNLEILSTYKNLLKEFDNDEDILEKKYVYNSLDTTILDDINTYLDLSFNTKIIGVSSNVITKDGYLLIAHRNKGVVDNSTLYLSFNGHSEIYDSNVEFYNESTYEDLPTITLLNENRLDFKNEFSREMYSELSISGFEKEYNLFGLSVLGMNQELWKKNNPGETNINRRLHFNLLATHTSNKLMDEILSIWKDSTEAFENDFIYGIKIIKCSNVFIILIKDVFLNFITLLCESK